MTEAKPLSAEYFIARADEFYRRALFSSGAVCREAATTITSLQAENADQRKRLEDAEAEVERLRQQPSDQQIRDAVYLYTFQGAEEACVSAIRTLLEAYHIRSQEKK